jgi:tetratricopeptide (TPR) repeat protein
MKRTIEASLVALLLSFLPAITLAEPASLDEGIRLYSEGSFEEALPPILSARESAPRSARAAYYLGLTRRQTGDYQDAVRNFRDALTLTPPAREAAPELIVLLINRNEDEEAARWLAWAEQEGVKPGEVAYLRGLLLRKQGKGDAAIAAFEMARQSDPALAGAADFQAALVRIDQREADAARRSFQAVITGEPNSDLAALAREYQASLDRLTGRRSPLELAIGVGYLYDTNVELNQAVPSGSTQSGRSDNGLTQYLRIGYTMATDSPAGFSADYRLFNTSYLTVGSYSQLLQSLRLIPSYRLQAVTLALPVSYSFSLLDYKGYQNYLEVKPSATISLAPQHLIQVAGGYGWRDMLTTQPTPAENRNADLYSGLVGYIFLFAGNQGMFNLRYEFTREETDGINWRNNGNRLNADLLVPVGRKTTLTLSGEGLWQNYINVNTYYNVKRDDSIYTGIATLTHNLVSGLFLHVQVLYTRALSNIALYDYSRTVTSTMLEYRF